MAAASPYDRDSKRARQERRFQTDVMRMSVLAHRIATCASTIMVDIKKVWRRQKDSAASVHGPGSDVSDLPSAALGSGSSDGQLVYFPRSLFRHTTAFSVCPQFS